MSDIKWKLKSFEELTNHELYAYLALRNEVFIVEQNCPYQDMDGLDDKGVHLLAWENDVPVACARLFAPGVVYEQASIGRVITKGSHRRLKLGHELMRRAIESCGDIFGSVPIKIGAQAYLQEFYESHGFKRISDIYLEDDIPHIKMLR
jgi:ElaA protein